MALDLGRTDPWNLTQFWPAVVPLLILATLAVALVALPVWEFDPLHSTIALYLIIHPLVLYAVLTFITKLKLERGEGPDRP